MIELLTYSLTVFTGFFAIMNPIANVPIFLTLVDGHTEEEKKAINKKAVITAFLIVLVFAILGKFIFVIFGLTIPAFKITGGILVFYVGFEMLQSKKSTVKHIQPVHEEENIAISPLAIPILSGPGTIVTAMNYVSDANYIHIMVIIFIFAIICLLTFVAFNLGEFVVQKAGKNVIKVVNKIMGLIIAVIGMNMIIEGVKLSFNL